MASEKLRHQYEGQLSKYTNVVKGWQFRWFVLDPETGMLHYYLNESEKKQRSRGSVHLAAAVISPSDEDSNTFTVNSASGELFKLRASDARARHEWVTCIRAVAEKHTMAIAKSNPPLPVREHHSGHVSLGVAASTYHGSSVHCSLPVLEALSSAREHIQKADHFNQLLCRTIEDLPSTGSITHSDPDFLILKATAQAEVITLNQCLTILEQQQLAQPQATGPTHIVTTNVLPQASVPAVLPTSMPVAQTPVANVPASSLKPLSSAQSTAEDKVHLGASHPVEVCTEETRSEDCGGVIEQHFQRHH